MTKYKSLDVATIIRIRTGDMSAMKSRSSKTPKERAIETTLACKPSEPELSSSADEAWDSQGEFAKTILRIEAAVGRPTTLESRLCAMVEHARAPLTGILVATEFLRTKRAADTCRAVVYCLLTHDWGNLSKVGGENAGTQLSLMHVFGLGLNDWATLKRVPPLVDCPYSASVDFVESLRQAR
ncbi:MAG: hypothetical protein CVT67_02870 [Actinobacteria bacterium HGW-Actinobacteria-7]|jgi:hypothetical protein|nr:MAG: hypothetical protein CVT67_02870 [Actinobacteria bacterium HGW-Actinobacteria-7]